MAEVTCPGLPASWLNGWLAAVAATVLDSRIRLRWTERTPVAVLSAERVDPVAALAASWPDEDVLADMPIAERWNDTPPMSSRTVSVDTFVARARAARGHPHSWALSSTMTDLAPKGTDAVAHAPFDPAGPSTTKWLHHRLQKVQRKVEPSPERLMDSLAGRAERIEDNGLGFDLTRMGSQSDAAGRTVDPVIEVLAFFGLALLPVRGAGFDQALVIQRGWRNRRFRWPAWSSPLDRAGIDALLDAWRPDSGAWSLVGVHAAWQSVRFRPRAMADPTRGFGSQRIREPATAR